MSRAEDQPYASGRYAAYVVVVLLLAFFMSYMDRQIITLLLPSLKAGLGVSDTQVSLIQGMAFASSYAFAGLPMGWIADRTNRRNMIVVGVIVWSLATLACGFADTFAHLFAARIFVGLGEAVLTPACVSLLADYFRPSHRGRAMGVVMTGAPLGSASSLLLGGLLLTSLTQGTAATLLPHGWAPWQIVFLAIGTPGLLVAFLVSTLREPPRRADHAALPTDAGYAPQPGFLEFFRAQRAAVGRFFGIIACLSVLTFSVASWAPTVLMRVYGMAPTKAGAIYGTILLVCGVSAAVCSGVASDWLVRRWPLNGRVLIPLCLFPVEIAAQTTFMLAGSTVVLVTALIVAGFSGALISGSFYPALQDLFPNQIRGRAAAMLSLVGNVIGMGCGPTLVALVTDHVFHDEMMLQKSVGIVAVTSASLGFLISLGLPRHYMRARRQQVAPSAPIAPVAGPPVAVASAAMSARNA